MLNTVLDLTLYLDRSHLRTEHRETCCSRQLAICDHILKRCANTGPLALSNAVLVLNTGNLRAIRKSRQKSLDQVLLDGCRSSLCTPNIHTLRRYLVDLQSVCIYPFVPSLTD